MKKSPKEKRETKKRSMVSKRVTAKLTTLSLRQKTQRKKEEQGSGGGHGLSSERPRGRPENGHCTCPPERS